MNKLSATDIRKIGIVLNGGKIHGWKINLANIMKVSIDTVSSWMAENDRYRRPSQLSEQFLIICLHLHFQRVNVRLLVEDAESLINENLEHLSRI